MSPTKKENLYVVFLVGLVFVECFQNILPSERHTHRRVIYKLPVSWTHHRRDEYTRAKFLKAQYEFLFSPKNIVKKPQTKFYLS